MVEKHTYWTKDGAMAAGVSATDYAALEARLASLDQKFMVLQGSHDLLMKERDEWKRRCNKMTYKLGNSPLPTEDGWRKWYQKMYASLIAIAEGGDNG